MSAATTAAGIPQLPQDISSDGREVWGWASRLSSLAARNHRMRELRAAIVEGETTCGSCSKWMTNACPREVSTQRGFKQGPSCKACKCSEFDMKPWYRQRIAELRAELDTLKAAAEAQQ